MQKTQEQDIDSQAFEVDMQTTRTPQVESIGIMTFEGQRIQHPQTQKNKKLAKPISEWDTSIIEEALKNKDLGAV